MSVQSVLFLSLGDSGCKMSKPSVYGQYESEWDTRYNEVGHAMKTLLGLKLIVYCHDDHNT
jgi:hypothetical protein